MYLKLALSCAFLAIASCKDIELGQNSTGAHKIFDEKREASPAVWRQIDKVTVNTSDDEIISRVVVTDLRPNKDGDANIVEGGDGNQTVTIELKSPTVLRGYEFRVEVYAEPNKDQHGGALIPAIFSNNQNDGQRKLNEEGNSSGNIQPPISYGAGSSTKPPVSLSTDVKINDGQRITRSPEKTTDLAEHLASPKQPETKQVPVDITKHTESDQNTSTNPKSVEVSTQLPGLKTNDHSRHARDMAKVSQSTTQVPSTIHPAKDLKDADGQAVNYPQWHVDKSGNTDKILIPGELAHDNKEDKPKTDVYSSLVPTSNSTTAKPTEYKTDKPRAVRDTEVTSPKTEQKLTTEPTNKNIQKIPTSGHIPIPTELKDFQGGNVPKDLEKPRQDDKTPVRFADVGRVPIPLQAVHIGHRDVTTEKATKTVGAGTSSISDEDDSSEEYKKPETPHTPLAAQKPKSI